VRAPTRTMTGRNVVVFHPGHNSTNGIVSASTQTNCVFQTLSLHTKLVTRTRKLHFMLPDWQCFLIPLITITRGRIVPPPHSCISETECFIVSSVLLSAAHTMQRRMSGPLMNSDFRNMWKEAIFASLR
jgi:hypothetical protein